MNRSWIVVIGIALAVGIASAQGMGHGADHGAAHHAPGMSMPSPQSELDFLVHMVEHHREAVTSAEALLTVAERDELIELAQAVIEAQTLEIATMQGWLAAWYPEHERTVEYVPMMRDLTGLEPQAAERAWIGDMIAHHMRAVQEAQQLLASGVSERSEVLELAGAIVADQQSEIATMQRWPRDWYGLATTGMLGGGHAMGAGQMMAAGHAMDAAHMMRRHMKRRHMVARHVMPRHVTGAARMIGAGHMMPGTHAAARGMTGECPDPAGAGARDDQGTAGPAAAGVEALARAFLAGRGTHAAILAVEPPRNVHRVTYRDGDAVRVLLVDADTGAVTEE